MPTTWGDPSRNERDWRTVIIVAAATVILAILTAPSGDTTPPTPGKTVIYEDDCRLPGREPCDSNDDTTPLPEGVNL